MKYNDNFVIGIPSYHRSNEQLTLEYLEKNNFDKSIIYISTQTKDDYELYLKLYGHRANVIYNEGTCVGDNRNNILNHFEDGTNILMLDDDIKYIGKKNDKNIEEFEEKELHQFLNDMFKFCKNNNALIWGGYPVQNAFFMNNKIEQYQPTVGCIQGIIKNKRFLYDRSFKIKEDLELCLRIISSGYKSIRVNFISTVAKHKSAGGCEEFWKDDSDTDCTNRLLLKYSNLIKKGNKENSILMKKKGS